MIRYMIRKYKEKKRAEREAALLQADSETHIQVPNASAASAPPTPQQYAADDGFRPVSAKRPISTSVTIKVVYFIGFCMALDFAAVLVSMQAYWYTEGGSRHLYGFAFGSYDLTQLIFAPVVGYLTGILSFRSVFLLLCCINAGGNIMYALAIRATEGWPLILTGRLIAGIGSAALSAGMVYITQSTTRAARTHTINKYRFAQTMARMLSPIVCTQFMFLPFTGSFFSVVNGFTIPAYLAALFTGVILPPMIYALFRPEEDAYTENEKLKRTGSSKIGDLYAHMSPELKREAFVLVGTMAVVTLAFWFFASNLFSIGLGEFHIIKSLNDTWKMYVGMGGGFLVASRIVKSATSSGVTDMQLIGAGAVIETLAFLVVMPWKGTHAVQLEPLFYIGQALLGISGGLLFPSLLSHYTKRIQDHLNIHDEDEMASDEASELPDARSADVNVRALEGFLIGLFMSAGAAGRFLGPTVSGPLLQVGENPALGECNIAIQSSSASFVVDGCYLPHAAGAFGLAIGLLAVGMSVLAYFNLSKSSIENMDNRHDRYVAM